MTRPSRSTWRDLDPEVAYAILRLRVDVFVVEQQCPYPELDGRDTEAGTEHLWLGAPSGSLQGTPPDAPDVGAYLRVLVEPGGGRRIGRVVTAASARGHGLAGHLVDDVVSRHGGGVLVLDAQAHLASWYARRGFTASGPEFVEDGIPHVPMRREPRASVGTRAGP